MERRVKLIEERVEMKEREDRNIMIKRVEVRKEKRMQTVKEILRSIGRV